MVQRVQIRLKLTLRQITSPVTKYYNVIGLILSDLVESIEDVVNNHSAFVDPYFTIINRTQ